MKYLGFALLVISLLAFLLFDAPELSGDYHFQNMRVTENEVKFVSVLVFISGLILIGLGVKKKK